MKKSLKNKTVFVGVSGGVDSSVSAALLKNAGYHVVGVFIRTWSPEWIECTWRSERRDAMRVCAHLDIPFLECDAEKEYKKEVADYMISEYKAGRTPNPDVMCNREIKFGVFWKFAKKHGADFIATGHYAINNYQLRIKNYELKKAKDPAKDQSYFLWKLNSKDLAHVIFPIGHLKKSEVRKLAEKFNLPTAVKKDSQGICMLGDLDIKDFLSHYIKNKKGDVFDESGETIGYHNGVAFLTIGERHGFTVTKKTNADGPYYVVAKDIKKNTITVSQEKNSPGLGTDNFLLKISSARASRAAQGLSRENSFPVSISDTNWISEIPKSNKKYKCQIRYHGEYLPCQILKIENSKLKISFQQEVLVAPGQSIVLYDGDVCLGGGIVV